MKRRQVLLGLGALTAGGTVVGSGAFTSVQAERDLTVTVADDDEALLALEKIEQEGYPNKTMARPIDGELLLDINGELAPDRDAKGVGSKSTYKFDGAFAIENQGTQSVYVESSFEGPDAVSVDFYANENTAEMLDGTDAVLELATGDRAAIGVQVEIDDVDVSYNEDSPLTATKEITATIEALATEPDDSATIVALSEDDDS